MCSTWSIDRRVRCLSRVSESDAGLLTRSYETKWMSTDIKFHKSFLCLDVADHIYNINLMSYDAHVLWDSDDKR